MVHRLHPLHSLRHFRVRYLPVSEENDDSKQAEKVGQDAEGGEGGGGKPSIASARWGRGLLSEPEENVHHQKQTGIRCMIFSNIGARSLVLKI